MDDHGAAGAGGALPELVGDAADARSVLLDLAVSAAGIGTFDWDLTTGTLRWDERLIELFGYDEASFDESIEAFNARLHPADVDRVTGLLQQAIDSVGEYSAEYRVLRGTGGWRWVAARGRALADEGGRSARLLGAAWDITARRHAQDRIAQIVDGMAVGFVATDPGWVMTHVNAEAERITGLPRAQLLGRTLWEAFPATVGTDFEDNARHAAGTGRPVTFDACHPAPVDAWVEVRAVPGPDGVAFYFLDITTRRLVQQQAERAAERERLLGRIVEELAGTLDAEEAVRRLSRLVVPAVADWCIVTLVDDDQAAGSRRGLRTAVSWHADPALREAVDAYAQARLSVLEDDAIIVRALRTGQAQVLAGNASARTQEMLQPGPVRELLRLLAPESVAVLPLPGRTGPVGMLTVCNGAGRGAATPEDLVTARHVAARSGLVLDNARLYRQQRGLAEGFQRSLLTEPPERDRAQIAVRYVPAAQAAEVGGDWYDAFLQPGGATVLVIGDVVGHDAQAAAAMGQARTIVRTLAARGDEGPAAVLTEVEQVMQVLQSGILATAVVARLEQTDGERARGLTRLRWSNAGHPPPMVITPDARVRRLDDGRADLLLGATSAASRQERQLALGSGSVVLLYTDGLVERRDEDLDHGLDRLQATLTELAGRDLDDLCDQVLLRMLPACPDDDVALIAVQLHPQDRPPAAGQPGHGAQRPARSR